MNPKMLFKLLNLLLIKTNSPSPAVSLNRKKCLYLRYSKVGSIRMWLMTLTRTFFLKGTRKEESSLNKVRIVTSLKVKQ